jgi:hypothetical protein
MIYRLFNINKPIVLTTLPVICVILWLPSFLITKGLSYLEKYSLLNFFSQLPIAFGQILSMLIILSTAILISYTINKSELFSKNQYLPALIYVLVMSFINEHHVINPIVVANLFLVLAIYMLFKIYRQIPCKNLIFKSSCLIMIASIFYFPYILFFPLPWIILSIIRPFDTREWLMPIVSLFLIVFYVVLINEIHPSFFKLNNIYNIIAPESTSINYSIIIKIVFGLMVFGCFTSLIILMKLNVKSTNRFRKLNLLILSIFLIFIALSILNYFYYFNLSIIILISAIPVSLLLPFTLIHIKKKWLSEIYISSIFILIFFDLLFV